jgi:hypothetical protein
MSIVKVHKWNSYMSQSCCIARVLLTDGRVRRSNLTLCDTCQWESICFPSFFIRSSWSNTCYIPFGMVKTFVVHRSARHARVHVPSDTTVVFVLLSVIDTTRLSSISSHEMRMSTKSRRVHCHNAIPTRTTRSLTWTRDMCEPLLCAVNHVVRSMFFSIHRHINGFDQHTECNDVNREFLSAKQRDLLWHIDVSDRIRCVFHLND